LGTKKPPCGAALLFFVPEVGIEPTLLAEHEFESCASTSSAIRANGDDKSNLEKAFSSLFATLFPDGNFWMGDFHCGG
jgi:hypothetical protein